MSCPVSCAYPMFLMSRSKFSGLLFLRYTLLHSAVFQVPGFTLVNPLIEGAGLFEVPDSVPIRETSSADPTMQPHVSHKQHRRLLSPPTTDH